VAALGLVACAHQSYEPVPAKVGGPTGSATFDDCELEDGSSVPSDFPRGTLAPAGPAEHSLACGLSAQLAALGEPSLFPLPGTTEVYRVLWIRADGHPVSVRVDRQDSASQVRGAQTSGKGLGTPGELLEESSSNALPSFVQELVTRVGATRFWAPLPQATAIPPLGTGSTWVFEGTRDGEYRVRTFQRETLARDPEFAGLARTLVGASGLHIEGAVY
jgi:hypothetical protein